MRPYNIDDLDQSDVEGDDEALIEVVHRPDEGVVALLEEETVEQLGLVLVDRVFEHC